ncbi:hypothetical protein CKO36_14145 [Rhabdochromatium marinum]|nr:c-type cytochrome [Rhabdochromatium marinum]MBK1649706.1 hypothetical protein [Rhabdochromatium marinum]
MAEELIPMVHVSLRFILVAMLPVLMQAPQAVAGDSERGAKIARAGTATGVPPCMSCHGPRGMGQGPAGYPRIAGLDAGYIARQLLAFRDGTRENPVMDALIKPLTQQNIDDLASYYAALPLSERQVPAPSPEQTEVASVLARFGDWAGRALPGCGQCHGPDGNGIGAGFPGIAGQHANYLKAQLLAWRTGKRSNDPSGLMASVAQRLTEAEIDALAAYYDAQPAGSPVATRTVPATPPEASPEAPQPDRGTVPTSQTAFQPPPRTALPSGPLGEAVRLGQAIFVATNTHPLSAPFVGNRLACQHCHLDAGRLANSGPLWAAWVAYPEYKPKNHRVDTFAKRAQGCFVYSLNAQASAAGGAPAVDSRVIDALVAYSYWLATGAPTGNKQMAGRGYPSVELPAQAQGAGFDPARGARVYQQQCALCHGEQGEGVSDASGRTLFPPLWGAHAYNWGAGMHRIDIAAAFIKHNMPLGQPESLSDQQAWDVAAFINRHERPQDPRFDGDLAVTTARFHTTPFDEYGKVRAADGHVLGSQPASSTPLSPTGEQD